MKRDKYLIRSLDFLELKFDEAASESDIDSAISENKEAISKMENIIEDAKDVIESANYNLDLLSEIKHQMKIERYKELNPGKEIF